MSFALINRSPDLQRLRDEGHEIEIRSGHLLVHSVPYVNASGKVARASLVSELTMAGNVTVAPRSHTISFTGDHPCHRDGREIAQIKHVSQTNQLAVDIVVQHSFSNKPPQGYKDYHEKVTRYIEIISGPACALEPDATARTFKPIASAEEESVFLYVDTASSRAGIAAVTAKLAMSRVAIVGLGGTGAYLLDLVAKTPVKEIHLFDGDIFLQHNAFRAPSAPSLEELEKQPTKVAYLKSIYSKMRRNIIERDVFISEGNMAELLTFDFVFLCFDSCPIKKLIVETLQGNARPFIDVGLGVELLEDSLELLATCRVTLSSASKQDHVARRVGFSEGDEDDLYANNIQIADLNALNAALAVIKWKKVCGFYQDLEREHNSTYTTNCNLLTTDEVA